MKNRRTDASEHPCEIDDERINLHIHVRQSACDLLATVGIGARA